MYRGRVVALYVTSLIEGIGWMAIFFAALFVAAMIVAWLFGQRF